MMSSLSSPSFQTCLSLIESKGGDLKDDTYLEKMSRMVAMEVKEDQEWWRKSGLEKFIKRNRKGGKGKMVRNLLNKLFLSIKVESRETATVLNYFEN